MARPAQRPHLLRRPPPGLHRVAAGGLPGDGVRRAARGRARGAPRGRRALDALGPADQLPGRDPGRPGRRHPALDGLRPGLLLPGLPHPPRRRAPRLLRADGADPARRTTAARTGASCTPGRPPTWRRRTRASTSSWPCATGSTRTGCSPTTTCAGSSATERDQVTGLITGVARAHGPAPGALAGVGSPHPDEDARRGHDACRHPNHPQPTPVGARPERSTGGYLTLAGVTADGRQLRLADRRPDRRVHRRRRRPAPGRPGGQPRPGRPERPAQVGEPDGQHASPT